MERDLERQASAGSGDDEDLRRRFLLGERDAVAQVAALARGVVRSRSYAVPRAEQDDLAQEVVLQVYRSLGAPGLVLAEGLPAFVRSIAHRRLVDWVRRQRAARRVTVSPIAPLPAPDETAIARERLDLGRAVLRQLSADCRTIMRLRACDGLSHRAIAERLGRSEGGVRNLLSTCLQEARRFLEEAKGRGTPRPHGRAG